MRGRSASRACCCAGAQLLNIDVRDRRRDLDNRVARLNQRVAALSAEADAAAKHAEAAARRVGGKAQTRAPGPDFLDAGHSHAAAARGFLAALGERMSRGPSQGAPERLDLRHRQSRRPAAGGRDRLDRRGAERDRRRRDRRAGARSGAPRRSRSAVAAEARRRFDKWLQVVVNLPGTRRHRRRTARRAPARDATDSRRRTRSIRRSRSALAEPLSSAEAALLTALAPLAADSPRAAKRFLNAYRLARCADVPRPAIALMQAVAFADEETQAAMRTRLLNGGGDLEPVDGPDALVRAVKSARAANGGVLTVADARAADAVARRYALSL